MSKEFITVTKRKNGRKNKYQGYSICIIDQKEFLRKQKEQTNECEENITKKLVPLEKDQFNILQLQFNFLKETLVRLQNQILASKFYKDFKEKLKEDSVPWVQERKFEVISYGIGNFFTSKRATWQLALLYTLIKDYEIEGEVFLYDPMFSELERTLIPLLGFLNVDKNEEAKRPISRDTIFYMPHCGRCLYNNVLVANWEYIKMKQIIIIGNSFSSYSQRIVPSNQYCGIDKIIPFTIEKILVETDLESQDAFNDTSIHFFPSSKLLKTSPDFWDSYVDYCSDTELIPQSIIK